jgi:hypothetical protein
MVALRNILLITFALFSVVHLSAQQSHCVAEYVNKVNPKQSARMASNGIIIVGKAPTARAMSGFNGKPSTASACADCCSFYRSELGDQINIYLLAIPSANSFYMPDAVRSWVRSEAEMINAIYALLDESITIVDVYSALAEHADEAIYSRTDHHWAPLGGYYAAEAIAKAAGLPFCDLSCYEQVKVPNYVGSMYSFTNDSAILHSPETFIYHKPLNVDYTTTYITYSLASDHKRIIGESRPKEGKFFYDYRGGGAYCSFMGSDCRITQVKTSTDNGRRVLIIKDSFGNVIPGYLFYTFEQIHVVDFRFFNKNLKRYIEENGITDVVISTNISFASSASVMSRYKRLLVQ